MKIGSKDVGRSWYPPETSFIFNATMITDASSIGWGSHVHIHDKNRHGDLNNVYQDDIYLGHGAFNDE
jgi:hypothetical protein